MRPQNVPVQLVPAAIFLVSLAYAFPSVALDSSCSYSKLNVQGTEYPSACEPEELKALHDELLHISVVRPEVAWSAIHTLLCGSNNIQTRQLIKKIVVPRVEQTWNSTGEKLIIETSRRTEELIGTLIREGTPGTQASSLTAES